MKLKKIASLALAGVMAVSMLTACGDNDKKDPTPEQGGETVVAGYSSTLADELSDDVTDLSYVTFKDNSDDTAALKKALNYVSEESLKTLSEHRVVWSLDQSNLADVELMRVEFEDEAKLDDPTADHLVPADLSMEWYADNNGVDNVAVKDGALFVVNGAVGVDEALEQVANALDEILADLPEHNTTGAGAGAAYDKYTYDYTVSASVATKALDDTYVGVSNSAIFVAVTVTRTVTVE